MVPHDSAGHCTWSSPGCGAPIHSSVSGLFAQEKIGSGSYGVVFKVVRKVDRMIYAMKEIDLQGMSRKVGPAMLSASRLHDFASLLAYVIHPAGLMLPAAHACLRPCMISRPHEPGRAGPRVTPDA